jgi:hypothetical protein
MIGGFLSNETLRQGRQGRPVSTNACKGFDRRSPTIAAKIKQLRRETSTACFTHSIMTPSVRLNSIAL